MVAAAFKVTLVLQNKKGQRKAYYMSASDVNAAAWTFPSGATEIPVSSETVVIADMIFSAAGTDTTNSSIYINGDIQPTKIVHSSNVSTVLGRQFQSCPIAIPAGSAIKFEQNT